LRRSLRHDILFAEECQRLGAPVRLLLALPRAQFVAQSVAFAGYDWVRRFDRLTETCEVAEQTSRLGDPPAGFDVFSRCNLWILNSARVEIGSNSQFHRDPTDRAIIAAARAHRLPVLTRDRKIIDSGLVEIWTPE
jgi:hypothetical protein